MIFFILHCSLVNRLVKQTLNFESIFLTDQLFWSIFKENLKHHKSLRLVSMDVCCFNYLIFNVCHPRFLKSVVPSQTLENLFRFIR